MLQVMVFNAKPRAGKDFSANFLANSLGNTAVLSFKDKLILAASNFLGITSEQFLEGYDKKTEECLEDWNGGVYDYYSIEWFKDVPMYSVNGKLYSKRGILIHVSENVLKPLFGEEVMGLALVNDLPEDGYVFVPDSGFHKELMPVIDAVGKDNVTVVRLHRDGCDFGLDSRSYLNEEDFDEDCRPNFVDIDNNEGLLELEMELLKTAEKYLK